MWYGGTEGTREEKAGCAMGWTNKKKRQKTHG